MPTSEEQTDEQVMLTIENDKLVAKSLLENYAYRGTECEDMNMLEFVKDTYETSMTKQDKKELIEFEQSIDDEDRDRTHPQDRISKRRGRPRHVRSMYLENHSSRYRVIRVIRPKHHKTLLAIAGQYFPNANDIRRRDYYCASMVTLLKPWRRLSTLKSDGLTWEEAFDRMQVEGGEKVAKYLSNIQYYYDSKETAERNREKERKGDKIDHPTSFELQEKAPEEYGEMMDGEVRMNVPIDEDRPVEAPPTAQELARQYELMACTEEVRWNATNAVTIGAKSGLLFERSPNRSNGSSQNYTNGIRLASGFDLGDLETWRSHIAAGKRKSSSEEIRPEREITSNAVQGLNGSETGADGVTPIRPIDTNGGTEERNLPNRVGRLNTRQRMAFDMIREHVESHWKGESPEQLLLNVQGGPGTGKSEVIKAVVELFELHGKGDQVGRCAPTGIAACSINGQTLHSAMNISIEGKTSRRGLVSLGARLQHMKYLIIDEISMVDKTLFALVDKALSDAKRIGEEYDERVPDETFGGVNLIIVGDFHQFPPVGRAAKAALYMPSPNTRPETDMERQGGRLYHLFDKVVVLKEQMRAPDPVWMEILNHARMGTCRPSHLVELRNLVMKPNMTDDPLLQEPEWKDAVLVTPRHAVRRRWNTEAVKLHCQRTSNKLFLIKSDDRIDGRPITLDEINTDINLRKTDKKKISPDDDPFDRGKLPNVLECAIGSEVMLTNNISTNLGMANGARGTVQSIVLDPDETADLGKEIIEPNLTPAYITVKLHGRPGIKLDGLEEDVVPIIPTRKLYKIRKRGCERPIDVYRTQFPLTPAYAMTDYRAQGQTFAKVIVDIGKPPRAPYLTPFNAYVAISRSKGRHGIRLLRQFEDRLFTTEPNKELLKEDKRLEELSQKLEDQRR